MNKLHVVLALLLLGLFSLFIFSCKDKDEDNPVVPPIPNFDGSESILWSYQNAIELDLDYYDTKTATANCWVMMSSKGENSSATLKINGRTVVFDETDQCPSGKTYYGYIDSLDTTQPINYLITNAKGQYTGTIAVPQKVTSTFPVFDPLANYTFAWTFSPNNALSPNFNVAEFGVTDTLYIHRYTDKQLAGTTRQYTIDKSFWAGLTLPMYYYGAWIQCYTYAQQNDNNVLTVGFSGDGNSHYEDKILENRHGTKESFTKAIYYVDKALKGEF